MENGGTVMLNGRLGFLSESAGQVTAAYLIAGTDLTREDFRLTSDAWVYEGTVESAVRKCEGALSDAFITSAELPDGTTLRGWWMVVTHGNGFTHGYEIDRVDRSEDKTYVHLTYDHGLRIDGDVTEECYFPNREIRGQNRFRIYTAAAFVRQGR